MFEQFLEKKIINVKAYGSNQFDVSFALGNEISFLICNTGIFELIFSNGSIYFSIEGISDKKPKFDNPTSLPVKKHIKDYFKGLIIQDIYLDKDNPLICFTEKMPITFKLVNDLAGQALDIDLYNPFHLKQYVKPGTLKRCPRCGGQGDVCVDMVTDGVVVCRNCGASTYAHYSCKDAIKSWNDGLLMPR